MHLTNNRFLLLFVSFSLNSSGLEFIYSQRGRPLLIINNYLFRKNRGSYWRCIRCSKNRCKSRVILRDGEPPLVVERHSHGPESEKISFGRKVKSSMSSTEVQRLSGFECRIDPLKIVDAGRTTPVQLYMRHPHFDADSVIAMDEDENVGLSIAGNTSDA